jgi:hypothetical protein
MPNQPAPSDEIYTWFSSASPPMIRALPHPALCAKPAHQNPQAGFNSDRSPPNQYRGLPSLLYRGFPNPQAARSLDASPIWKSATQQVWKPAIRGFGPVFTGSYKISWTKIGKGPVVAHQPKVFR